MIQVLSPDEARKIAAGEVIDRPAALVREFLDNAIDSGAARIEVSIEGGGVAKTEVSDDGSGMGRDDLEICWLAHATSKIRSLDDLKTAETLGFRGEALAAAAAVSRLEIVSCAGNGVFPEAWKLTVGPGEKHPPRTEQTNRTRGTSVRSLGLFDAIPARKRFLKTAGSEANLCKTVFNDKALVFPNIEFRFVQDGKLKILLQPVSSFKERFVQLYFFNEEEKFIHEIAAKGQGYSVVIVIGGPEIYRSDRRQQLIFANGRRIQDYSLMQALEYGSQSWFPNGTHPAGAVFLNIDPALADFNIHPAKREARFADSASIHQSISSTLINFCRSAFMSGRIGERFTVLSNDEASSDNNSPVRSSGSLAFDVMEAAEKAPVYSHNAAEISAEFRDETTFRRNISSYGAVCYLGRIFGLFILVQKEDRLYIIDQHAAHERILFDRFLSGPVPRQELLVAIPLDTESEEDNSFLRNRRDELAQLGIVITEEDGSWRIEALPQGWHLADAETVQEILSLKNAGKNLAERWAATLSCRRAVKDGDYLDPDTALMLAEEALALPVRRCPHGRPILFEISREELLKAVRRL
ncbi:MAG: DNA mismatch repair endonuclease MutL [Treponema sp.]|jgi:DNA mismatch repair protein MutL|nr:DNA mismatch repair endonuclease MutL [Treponema sp.]